VDQVRMRRSASNPAPSNFFGKYIFRGEEKPVELARLLLQALDQLKAPAP
jgi:hypothetical protein